MPTQAGSTNKLNPIKGFAKFIPVTEEELNGTLGTFVFGAKMGLIFPDGSLRITDGQTALKDLPAVNITSELLQTALSVQYNHPIKVSPLTLTALIALQNQGTLSDQELIADSDKISMTAGFGVPTGTVLPFAGEEIPLGFLLCNGAAVSKATYSDLFGVIGSIYGDSGDADTFLLPDLRDRYICGVGTNSLGTYLAEQLPNILGHLIEAGTPSAHTGSVTSALYVGELGTGGSEGSVWKFKDIYLTANRHNNIYVDSGVVRPKTLITNYTIKY